MTIASETREAVRRRPFLHAALSAGVVNYNAAARHLGVGDEETVATALRRYADELPTPESPDREARVDMRSGLGPVDVADALLSVGDAAFGPDGGDFTAVLATGDVVVADLSRVLARLDVEGVETEAAGASEGHLVCLVGRDDGVDALRYVEDALSA
ncbi:DUF7523 family protein [Halosegnis marinus]|uniref:Uncharacterized protein n=1 Tax=Halosegnis marinus TaxID=3034023 RepID=A0ABD5ZR25_9EURY|nr:hypothetical protein [Halosegnis sp. DT85]